MASQRSRPSQPDRKLSVKVKDVFCTSSLLVVVLLYAMLVFLPSMVMSKGQYDWMKRDNYDEIDEKFHSVKGWNCKEKSKDQLVFRPDTVAQLPVYNQLLSRLWYRNRTKLIHLHNMALNRAFFFSYVLQKMNTSETFGLQPNWIYYYFSTVADLNANPNYINGSAMLFDNDCHYPNWYSSISFNFTMPLFGPKSFRWDNTKDQDNYLREPSKTVVKLQDMGAGRGTNYTHHGFKMNPWYDNWLPDTKGDMDSLTKFTYYIGIRKSSQTGEFDTKDYKAWSFFGPSSPSATEKDIRKLPVMFTQPYFDCGVSNKWIVSTVAPVIDFMPRYSNYTHLRRQRVVGVVTMDTDFNKIDFNACGVSSGNPGPSYLSGIARCRPTTGCKHKMGYGFRRGGYVCVCKSGWQYPWFLNPPYQGEDVEQATFREYMDGFQCTPTDYRLVLPVIDRLPGVTVEGAGGLGNGGGQEKGPQVGRRRRGAENNTVSSSISEEEECANTMEHPSMKIGSGKQTDKNSLKFKKENVASKKQTPRKAPKKPRKKGPPAPPPVKEMSPADMMWLADKLRAIGNRVKTEGPLTVNNSASSMTFDISVDGDYNQLNNVPMDVEHQYQSDIRRHSYMQRVLLDEHRRHGNMSRTTAALQEEAVALRQRHITRFEKGREDSKTPTLKRRKRAAIYDDQAFERMMRLLRHKSSVTPSTCGGMAAHKLQLPGDVGYGAIKQFQPEGQTAVRLSNFLSLYLQNVMTGETFGDLQGGAGLHEDQLMGEVLANVMGNFKIYSAGLFFDRYKFQRTEGGWRQYFGPWAFQKKGGFYVIDKAGEASRYTDEDWFIRTKQRWKTNLAGLKQFKIRPYIRSNPEGTSSIRHESFPLRYRAAPYEAGFWTRPHFRCDGNVDAWVMTYVSPFFGLDSRRKKLEFRGVTTVDVPLSLLEINQCPQPFSVANAFKNTARCDYFSSKCATQAGFPFMRGSYKCVCRLGFAYWHMDGKFWFEGSLVELEYEKKRVGKLSRFDHLNCRQASATAFTTDLAVLLTGLIVYVSTYSST